MDEENKIQDGDIISEEEKAIPEKKKRGRKTDLYIELVLFFILGILIGITLKTEANKRITIGYNDYQMGIKKSDYNINSLQVDLAKKSAEESSRQPESAPQENQEQPAIPGQGQADGGNAPAGETNQN
jgi:hypothetical protein